jgi:Calx-beta domain/S-layer homology domain
MKRTIRTSAIFVSGLLLGVATTAIGAGILGSSKFSDVPKGSFYDEAVGRLSEMGIIQGADGRFFPDRPVNRAELAVILDRALRAMQGGSVVTTPVSSAASSVTEQSSSRSRSSSTSSSRSSSSTGPTSSTAGAFRFTTEGFTVGSQVKKISVSVLRTGGTKGAVKVDYAFGGGTAIQNTDYAGSTGTVSFAEGENSKTIQVNLVGTFTTNKTIEATLSNPTGGAILGTPAKLTITVLAGSSATGSSNSSSAGSSTAATVQGAGVFTFNAASYQVRENVPTVTVTVVRNGGSTGAVGITYATSGGSATSGSHYQQSSGTLSFAAGETSKTFTVSVIDNGDIGGNKTVNLVLSAPTGGAGLGVASIPLTIVDDEAVTTVASGALIFNPNVLNVTEFSTTADLILVRQFNTSNTVTVSYSTNNGSAVASSDYTATTGTVTFLPGEATKVISVPILKDDLVEQQEYFSMNLSNPTGAGLGANSTATVNIQ